MEAQCTSFPPIWSAKCRVLVLGSMPGVASLAAQQYYAHPRNAFWPILYALWAQTPQADYAARVAFALSRRVAIWDVVQSCLRTGSSDASIRDVRMNDLEGLLADSPQIRAIFFNGRLAQSLFTKYARHTAGGRPCALLPSTSPAYTMPILDKTAAWRVLRAAAE